MFWSRSSGSDQRWLGVLTGIILSGIEVIWSVLKTLLAFLVGGVLWASGCVGGRPPDATGADPSKVDRAPQDPSEVDDLTYLMLVAEIAGQRGQFETALDYYMRLLKLTRDPGVASRATQVAVFVKNTDRALEAAETWSELDPKSIPAHRLILLMRVRSEDVDASVEEVRHLIRLKDPDLENTMIELAHWLASDKPRDVGLDILGQMADRLPKVAELQLAMAFLASESGVPGVAEERVAAALRLRPSWSRALMLKAQLDLQAGHVKSAKVALESARRSDPSNPRLGLLYGQFLARTGDFRAAERELARLSERDPSNSEVRFALASVWLELGELERARKEFDYLAAEPRWQAQAQFSIALIDARAGRTEQALREFERIKEGPLAFDARFNEISALIALGRTSEARERLAKARKDFPEERLRLYLVEAELLVKMRQVEVAFNLLSEGVEALPGQLELLYSRALLGEQLNRLDVMEADLKAVLEKSPDDAAALNALGFSLTVHRPDRLDEAESYIRRALSKRPVDPAILDSYGWVLYRKGKAQDALVPLRKAYGMFADPEIAAHLGEVLWSLGRRSEARRVWLEGWRKSPDQADMVRVRRDHPEAFSGVVP